MSALPKVRIRTWKRSVPPAVAGGSVIRVQNQQQYRMLISDPVATAPGTGLIQVQRLTF